MVNANELQLEEEYDMKKKLLLLLGAMVIIAMIGAMIISFANRKTTTQKLGGEDKLQIVTTIYPVYMIGLNIASGVDNIEVKSLTKLNTGCLHDYQLTTEDMKIIASADILVINGGGMEGFLGDVKINYPELTIIDASEGITMLPYTSGGFELETDESDEEHGKYNAHVWLNPKLYVAQIENVRDGIKDFIKENNSDDTLLTAINTNAQTYIDKVKVLDSEIEASISDFSVLANQIDTNQVVIFHDSFAYLADRIGLNVAFAVPLDSDTALSAADIAKIIDEVNTGSIKYLFTEQQFSDSIAKQIEAETEAKMYIIDSAVTGDGSPDSYLNSMRNNLHVLQEALQ